MIDSLAAAVTLAALIAALAVLVAGLLRRYRWKPVARVLVGFEVLLVGQAVLAVVGLATGHQPRELATHLAYLAVSVLVLPAAAAQVRGDEGRWAALLVAVGFAVVAVVVVRAQTTWRPV